jgi:ribosome biogenesis GTPase
VTQRTDAEPAQDGRVIASHGRDALVLDDAGQSVPCRLEGRRLSVVCGDRVRWVRARGEGAAGRITEVRPRATVLARLNLRGEVEPVAANLTQLVCVVAPLPAPDFGLCDRYLAAAEWAGLKACVVASKSDLADPSGALAATLGEYVRIGYPVVRASKRAADGVGLLTARLAGETSVLVGQSGVGKSSLINRLVPGVEARVEEVSRATEQGRHTTSTSSLYQLPTGGELIDSPGVRFLAAIAGAARPRRRVSRNRGARPRLPVPGLQAPARTRLRRRHGRRRRAHHGAAAGELSRAAGPGRADGAARAAVQAMSWRPASACASVPPSTYSSSPPTGTPWAMRERGCRPVTISRKCAVAS